MREISIISLTDPETYQPRTELHIRDGEVKKKFVDYGEKFDCYDILESAEPMRIYHANKILVDNHELPMTHEEKVFFARPSKTNSDTADDLISGDDLDASVTERPNWNQYFMTMAYLAASRSQDASTHAGAVIVRADNTVVSTGYNNPIRGMDISMVPATRPEKYCYMEHAERNAIYAAAKNEGGLDGCKLYVNFLPCADCARAIVQAGIVEVIVHTEGWASFIEAGGELTDSYAATQKLFATPLAMWRAQYGALFAPKELVDKWTTPYGVQRTTIITWWSGALWEPAGFFRGKEFKL